MNLEQFLTQFRRMIAELKPEMEMCNNSFILSCAIRLKYKNHCFCPVTAVCYYCGMGKFQVTDYMQAADKIGMRRLLAGEIATAADDSERTDICREIRKSLMEILSQA